MKITNKLYAFPILLIVALLVFVTAHPYHTARAQTPPQATCFTPAGQQYCFFATLAGPTTLVGAAGCSAASTVTVTGAQVTHSVIVTPQATTVAPLTFYAYVSAANTVSFLYCNASAGGVTPTANTFNIRVMF